MVAGLIIAVFQPVRMLTSPLIGYHVSSFTVEMYYVLALCYVIHIRSHMLIYMCIRSRHAIDSTGKKAVTGTNTFVNSGILFQ